MDRRLKILDIWVDPMTKEECLQKVRDFLNHGNRPHSVFAANPEKNFSVPKDPLLYETFKNADLLIPDGIGMVIAARFLYGARLARVPGVELMESICELAAREGKKIFVYGAKEEVNKSAVGELKRTYPRLDIAGRCHVFLDDVDLAATFVKGRLHQFGGKEEPVVDDPVVAFGGDDDLVVAAASFGDDEIRRVLCSHPPRRNATQHARHHQNHQATDHHTT